MKLMSVLLMREGALRVMTQLRGDVDRYPKKGRLIIADARRKNGSISVA
jgi:hypothetical protein